jgi:hypothetical protein
MKRFTPALVAILIAFASPAAASPVETAAVTISLSCNSNPERATLTNNRGHSLVIYSVGSTYAQRSGEPYHVNRTVAAHKAITYQSGSNASKHVLTHQFIYNDDVRDGVRFKTSIGNFVRHCY